MASGRDAATSSISMPPTVESITTGRALQIGDPFRVVIELDRDRPAFGRRRCVERAADRVAKRRGQQANVEPSLLDLRQVKEVFDQSADPVGLAAEPVHHLL